MQVSISGSPVLKRSQFSAGRKDQPTPQFSGFHPSSTENEKAIRKFTAMAEAIQNATAEAKTPKRPWAVRHASKVPSRLSGPYVYYQGEIWQLEYSGFGGIGQFTLERIPPSTSQKLASALYLAPPLALYQQESYTLLNYGQGPRMLKTTKAGECELDLQTVLPFFKKLLTAIDAQKAEWIKIY